MVSSEKMHKTGVFWMRAAAICMLGSLVAARSSSGLHSEQSAPPSRVQQCREGCLEKNITGEHWGGVAGVEKKSYHELVTEGGLIHSPNIALLGVSTKKYMEKNRRNKIEQI
ncbi:hypothetical protein DMENIID0001_071880 [Sergentomyia squamirostris]